MLSLDLALSREQRNQRLKRLREVFALYFGFVTDEQISEALAYQAVHGQTPQVNSTSTAAEVRQQFNQLRLGFNNQLAKEVFDIFVAGDHDCLLAIRDLQAGARGSLVDRLIALTAAPTSGAPSNNDYRDLHRYIKIFYCGSAYGNVSLTERARESGAFQPILDEIGWSPTVSSRGSNINEAILKDRVAVMLMDHPIMAHNEKNSDLLSVYFNSFPSLEMARATPVLNLKMFSSRQVLQNDGTSNRLSAISLPKFLLGAQTFTEEAANPSLMAIALANQVTSSQPIDGQDPDPDKPFPYYSIAGMELFTAPQTLVNPDAARDESNFLAKPIDPFRPLASIKSFDVDVKSTGYGLIGTKQAHLVLTLHDRSRMGEFADFVKPDRYGSSFIEVEYGWSHPEGAHDLSADEQIGNPFGELMNLTRVKEHYNIVNGSFDFDEVGQVNINLNLITRGVSEITEISITGEQNDIRSQLTAIENISRQINTLTDRVYRRNSNPSGNEEHSDSNRREVRGHQMLGAAGDAMNILTLNEETLKSFRDLERALNDRAGNGSPTAQQVNQLATNIRQLYGNHNDYTANNRTPRTQSDSLVTRLRQSINEKIRTALQQINKESTRRSPNTPYINDIFLRIIPSEQRNALDDTTSRQDGVKQNNRENAQLLNLQPNDNVASVISLGALITSFVAKPLAAIKQGESFKFREVQVYFYSFNNKASRMSNCNIASFPIFTKFFAREYSKFRLENAARASSVSLSEFMNFIASTMIDDPMNPAYGINTLYKSGRQAGEQLAPKNNQDVFDREMQRTMVANNVTKSPDFQMPQIVFELESVPYGINETVLKVHIYDRTSSARSPLRELLSLSTEDTLATVSSIPASRDAEQASVDQQVHDSEENRRNNRNAPRIIETDLRQNWADCYHTILSEVSNRNDPNQLIEVVTEPTRRTDSNPGPQNDVTPPRQYFRFKGGVKRLKQLVMRYTPHVIYGAMGTTVKSAKLASQQNSQLATINMIRNTNSDPILATGEQPGGIPLQIYPVELSLTTIGCPFIRYSQELFVDFNTNTTADNIYYVTGLQHKIEQGNFETTIKLTACDAFPNYRNFIDQLNSAAVRYTSLAATGTNRNSLSPGEAPAPAPTEIPSSAHGRGSSTGHHTGGGGNRQHRSGNAERRPAVDPATQTQTNQQHQQRLASQAVPPVVPANAVSQNSQGQFVDIRGQVIQNS